MQKIVSLPSHIVRKRSLRQLTGDLRCGLVICNYGLKNLENGQYSPSELTQLENTAAKLNALIITLHSLESAAFQRKQQANQQEDAHVKSVPL